MPSEFEEDDVIKELEDFVKPKRKTGRDLEGDDVYEMCDQMLEDLSYLDAQLESRHHSKSNKHTPNQKINSTKEVIERASRIIEDDEKQSQEKSRKSPINKPSKNDHDSRKKRDKKQAEQISHAQNYG